jgi:hypothetical protein
MKPLDIWMGHDARELAAFEVAESSIVRKSDSPVIVHKLMEKSLLGIYDRPWKADPQGFRIDERDGRPYSTEFAFTRFLVPYMMNYQGWAVFTDCDFLFKGDIREVFDLRDEASAVMVVKHVHKPVETVKMDGCKQVPYSRKNWSSFMLWNCAHPANKALTPDAVNNMPGTWLHGFEWLKDGEIGALPEGWNWLEGSSPTTGGPVGPINAIHYTRGGPWFSAYQNVAFASDWYRERIKVEGEQWMPKRFQHERTALRA